MFDIWQIRWAQIFECLKKKSCWPLNVTTPDPLRFHHEQGYTLCAAGAMKSVWDSIVLLILLLVVNSQKLRPLLPKVNSRLGEGGLESMCKDRPIWRRLVRTSSASAALFWRAPQPTFNSFISLDYIEVNRNHLTTFKSDKINSSLFGYYYL
jgi:hypothetical protein